VAVIPRVGFTQYVTRADSLALKALPGQFEEKGCGGLKASGDPGQANRGAGDEQVLYG